MTGSFEIALAFERKFYFSPCMPTASELCVECEFLEKKKKTEKERKIQAK